MTIRFYDTSALGKHYHPEFGSSRIDELLCDTASEHVVSRLAVIELNSALAKKVRTGVLSPTDLVIPLKRIRQDIKTKRYRVARLLVADYFAAESLIVRIAPTHNLRTLDALQLAIAVRLNRSSPVQFICADHALVSIAAQEGLKVINPESF